MIFTTLLNININFAKTLNKRISMIIRKQLELNRLDYYRTHLEIINAFLPVKLTPKEIEVLSFFMSLKGDIAKDRFGTTARKQLKEELGISPGGLGNYLRQLKQKGMIWEDNGKIIIAPILFPGTQQQLYNFKLSAK